MIVTTAGRTNDDMIRQAEQIAKALGSPYVPRIKRSVLQLMESVQDDCLVVGKNRLELYPHGEEEPFFFHPNSAMFRVKRLLKGERDPFLEASGIGEGMSLLDCTLGLGSDSIVASFAAGASGKVIGVEGNPFLAYIVAGGLTSWNSGLPSMDEAMRRVSVVQGEALAVMERMEGASIDCVYFDPMFEESILESDGIRGLTNFALNETLTKEMMEQALRIARKRIILKDHFRSSRFENFGFKVFTRKSAKFHFGVIEKP
jgi:hypothetical protein